MEILIKVTVKYSNKNCVEQSSAVCTFIVQSFAWNPSNNPRTFAWCFVYKSHVNYFAVELLVGKILSWIGCMAWSEFPINTTLCSLISITQPHQNPSISRHWIIVYHRCDLAFKGRQYLLEIRHNRCPQPLPPLHSRIREMGSDIRSVIVRQFHNSAALPFALAGLGFIQDGLYRRLGNHLQF